MKNLDLLLTNSSEAKHDTFFENFIIKGEVLGGKNIYDLLEHIKWKESQKSFGVLEVIIQCKHFQSTDVVNVLEIIMLYLAENHRNLATIEFTKHNVLSKTNLYYINSILPQFNKRRLGQNYIEVFKRPLISFTHYRKLFENANNKSIISSHAMTDISMFLEHSPLSIDDAFIDNFSEIVGEIIANGMEHSDGDCLVDVKCLKTAAGLFVSLNVVSITNIFIGAKLIELFLNKELKNYPGFKIVKKAFKNHKKHFDKKYDIGSFGFLCSFQNTVSTRGDNLKTGGTGLTTMVKNLHDYCISNQYLSYIISGNNALSLRNDYLTISETGNIGFNDTNDFYRKIPKNDVVIKEPKTFPGTIFSINLIMKG